MKQVIQVNLKKNGATNLQAKKSRRRSVPFNVKRLAEFSVKDDAEQTGDKLFEP